MTDKFSRIGTTKNTFSSKYSPREIEALLDIVASQYDMLTYEETQMLRNKGISNLSTFNNNYEDLLNTPTIPSKLSDLENDISYIERDEVETIVQEIFRAAGFQPSSNKLSDYENDAYFVTETTLANNIATVMNVIRNLRYPTKYSDLYNDKGFISEHVIDDKIKAFNNRLNSMYTDIENELQQLRLEHDKVLNSIVNIEMVSHSHDNKDILDQITQAEPSVHVGTLPPKDPRTIWIDTNDSYIVDDMFNDIYGNNIVNQMLQLATAMGEKINALEKEIAVLKAKLESGEVGKPDDEDKEEEEVERPDSRQNIFISENGDYFVSEDGDKFILENNTKI